MPTPPEAMTSSDVAARTSARPAVSAPPMRPSTSIWVTTTASAPASASRWMASDHSTPDPSAQPRTATSRPRTSRPSATGCRAAMAGDQVGILQGGGAHDHPGDADVGKGSSRLGAAHATAGLHGHVDRFHDGRDERAVHRLAGAGGIEVHGVDPSGPCGHEPGGHRRGVVAVDPLAVEVALDELDDLAATEVDGRVEVHQAATGAPQRSTKAWSTARPVRADFSGWNWVAHTDPRATDATTGPPYSQVLVTRASSVSAM